jgi:broad specificity phosphatase PhoE
MPTRFTLIRHGQTDWNVTGKWQGHAYVGLNEEGHIQARKLAEAMVGTDAHALYTSDLPRARETALYLADSLKLALQVDVRLREIDVGEWQGLTSDEVERYDGSRLAAVRAGGATARRPGGESQEEVGKRTLALMEELHPHYPNHHILLVTHGGTVVNTLRVLGLLRPEHDRVDNTSQTVLVYDPETRQYVVEAFNRLTHLDAPIPSLYGDR